MYHNPNWSKLAFRTKIGLKTCLHMRFSWRFSWQFLSSLEIAWQISRVKVPSKRKWGNFCRSANGSKKRSWPFLACDFFNHSNNILNKIKGYAACKLINLFVEKTWWDFQFKGCFLINRVELRTIKRTFCFSELVLSTFSSSLLKIVKDFLNRTWNYALVIVFEPFSVFCNQDRNNL